MQRELERLPDDLQGIRGPRRRPRCPDECAEPFDRQADGGGWRGRERAQLVERDCRQIEVQVDAVEQRDGNAAAVALDDRATGRCRRGAGR